VVSTAATEHVVMKFSAALIGLAIALTSARGFAHNLVPDPSFEAPTPAWFSEEGNLGYFAAKEAVAGAADGANVLAIAGWDRNGSLIASGPVTLGSRIFSGSLAVRSFGASTDGIIEFALYDASKKTKLASFGRTAINGTGKWATIQASGVTLSSAASEGALVILVSGSMRGSRIEVDKAGLFPGRSIKPVTDTAEFAWFEAEAMKTSGKAWRPVPHFSSWYQEFPSGETMLSGSDGVAAGDDIPAKETLNVRAAGKFTLWVRLLRTNFQNHGALTIALEQRGTIVATKEIDDDSDATFGGSPMSWVFTPLSAVLQPGPVEVVLSRPPAGTSWVTRKVDMFALTNLADYRPKIQDFRPQGYVRFTNTSDAPFCLFQSIRRHQGPVYEIQRMWTAAGPWLGYTCVDEKRLFPGTPGPWVRITDYLSPAQGHNNLTLLATNQSHLTGFVSEGVKGTLEFAVGRGHQVVKTLQVEQASPRILLTLSAAFTPETILVPGDYLAKEEAAVARIASRERPRAKYLDLAVILGGIGADLDPPDLVEREIGVVEGLGFNATYMPLIAPEKMKAFYLAHGLEHVGIWGAQATYRAGDTNDPDRAGLAAQWTKISKDFAPVLDRLERAKIFDEPRGMSYEAVVRSPFSRAAFAPWLKSQGLSESDVGVPSWQDALPVGPEQSKDRPRLFYWTGMYRLNSLANAAKAVVATKKAAGLPETLKTYANYDPTSGNASFTQAGADPFLMQRDGGFELGWTEDWLGYGASVEQVSDQVAVIRAAGAPTHQELGMYVVGTDGPPALQRLRLYEALAAGVRHICSYNYGPYYGSIDSWGARYDVYPFISDALHDFGAVDAALEGTTRRRSDVAVLYNRTAAIWAGRNTAMEQDGRFLFWALSHAGYQPDFIPEEDVERGDLARYRVLYALGTQMRKRTASAIAQWVSNGGAVFATAGAGSRDEYDQPLDALEKTFGARSTELSLVADPGRPKYELRTLRPLGVIKTVAGSGAPDVEFNRLCATETLTPAADAKVVLRDQVGGVAGVLHSFGKGMALRVAALPGITYLNDAVRGASFDIESYHPTQYRPELRDFIAFLPKLAHAERVETNAPIAEVVRYDARDRSVLIVVNHGAPVPNFEVTLRDAQVANGYSGTGTPVAVHGTGAEGTVNVQFDLKEADAIVLGRRIEAPRRLPHASRTPLARCGCALGVRESGRRTSLNLLLLGIAAATRRRARRGRPIYSTDVGPTVAPRKSPL
jgi:hypothetical protein